MYVKVKTGVSADNYTQVTSGLSESDTIAYDPGSVSSDSYYDYGGNAEDEVTGGPKTVRNLQQTKSPQTASTPPRPARSW